MSKYDQYWARIIDDIAVLIREAYIYGRSMELDVSGLREYGACSSWYGRVDVSRDGFRGEMTHVRALGRLICSMGILES